VNVAAISALRGGSATRLRFLVSRGTRAIPVANVYHLQTPRLTGLEARFGRNETGGRIRPAIFRNGKVAEKTFFDAR